jgi:hypothetical protein
MTIPAQANDCFVNCTPGSPVVASTVSPVTRSYLLSCAINEYTLFWLLIKWFDRKSLRTSPSLCWQRTKHMLIVMVEARRAKCDDKRAEAKG